MDDRLSKSGNESDAFQAAPDVPTLDGGSAQGSTDAGRLGSGAAVATLDAGLARERTRQALFGATEVEHKIGRYTVIDQIGSGAMGIVYSAYDPDLDRKIAVKLVRSSRRDRGPETRERMIAEARAMAKVSHPNAVSVFEVGVTEGDPPSVFVAMEFIEGRTLRKWLADDKPTWRKIVAAYAAAGRGLAAVHRAGLVHRDFKPENAMIDAEGRVRVMDFGLARDTDDQAAPVTSSQDIAMRTEELTRTGELVGTPAYMAPERFSGLAAHPGSDQWAFCIALYEALWGVRPFVADTVGRLATIVVSATKPPDAPSSSVPRRIRAAILRGLHPDPDERWPSMSALVTALSSRRRNFWAMMWLGVGGLALASGWVLHVPAPRDAPCELGREALAGAWGPERAVELRSAFESAAPWGGRAATAVIASLDAWSDDWIAQHREACEATRVLQTQSDAMLDRRMQCLDRRRRELDALVGELAQADATGVELAEDAVDGLVPPERCADAVFLDAATEPPSDPEVARAVDGLRGTLAEIDAAAALGRPELALARARELADGVAATEYGPLEAEVAFTIGRLLFETSEPDASRVQLERAYFGARSSRNPIVAADAALHLASLDITFGNEFDRGEHWLQLAEVEAEGHGLQEQAVTATDMRITLYERRGELELAIADCEALLERLTSDCGEACEQLGETHQTLAHLYAMVSRYEDAIVQARRGLELDEERYGSEHLRVAKALMRLGDVLEGARHYEEAEQALARAVKIREGALGPDHMTTSISRVELGVSLVGLERADEGIAQLERALAAIREVGEKQTLAAGLNQLGWAYGEVGRHVESRATLTEAADIMRSMHPNGHPFLAIALSNIAGEAAEVGDHEGARVLYEEALAMRRKVVSGRDPQVATFLVNLGRTLAELGRNDEAIAHLQEALDMTRDEPLGFVEVGGRASLAKLLRETDPARANAVVEAGKSRCAAVSEASRTAAMCERLK